MQVSSPTPPYLLMVIFSLPSSLPLSSSTSLQMAPLFGSKLSYQLMAIFQINFLLSFFPSFLPFLSSSSCDVMMTSFSILRNLLDYQPPTSTSGVSLTRRNAAYPLPWDTFPSAPRTLRTRTAASCTDLS